MIILGAELSVLTAIAVAFRKLNGRWPIEFLGYPEGYALAILGSSLAAGWIIGEVYKPLEKVWTYSEEGIRFQRCDEDLCVRWSQIVQIHNTPIVGKVSVYWVEGNRIRREAQAGIDRPDYARMRSLWHRRSSK